ncbi:hypothetical protein C8J57DRAFT_1729513 [Mycena rebaudengoi]|nr:hypothetical protein C8J57DRAFT_1729513 [Mycena rebaudengoi]
MSSRSTPEPNFPWGTNFQAENRPKLPPGHVFASVEALAAHYGIPADLPPPPSLQPGSSASLPTPPEYHWRYSSSMMPGNGRPAARAKLPHPLPPEAFGLLFEQSTHLAYPLRPEALVRYLTATPDTFTALSTSRESRDALLQIASDLGITASDPRLRSAVQADEERITTWLLQFLDDTTPAEMSGFEHSAQYFAELIQNTLDKGLPMPHEYRSKARRILLELSGNSGGKPGLEA